MIDTLIFDAEGVVVDTQRLWDEEVHTLLEKRGVEYRREIIKPILAGRSLKDGAAKLIEYFGFDEDPGAMAMERKESISELFGAGIDFIDGFERFYSRIRDNYKTCIATAMDKDLLVRVDKRLGLSDLFSGSVFSIADVDYVSKPDPAIFLFAAKKMGSGASGCLVLEDAPNGILAARNAGMKCLALSTTFEPEALRGADFIVNGYAELGHSGLDAALDSIMK